MSEDTPDIKLLHPEQLGWMRRKELEKPNSKAQVWEKPNGELFVHDGHKALVLQFMKPFRSK